MGRGTTTSEVALVNETSSFIDDLSTRSVRLMQREKWGEEYPEAEDGHGGDRQARRESEESLD